MIALAERCACGACILEPLAPAALAARLAAQWLGVAEDDAGALGWAPDEADTLEMLLDEVAQGHVPFLPRETALVVAALVHALMDHYVDRLTAAQRCAS